MSRSQEASSQRAHGCGHSRQHRNSNLSSAISSKYDGSPFLKLTLCIFSDATSLRRNVSMAASAARAPNSPVRLPKLLYVMIQRPLWGRTARAHFSTQHGHARMQEPFVPNKHPEGRSRTAAGSCHGLAARVLVVLGWLVVWETKWGPGPFKRPTVKLY